MHKLVLMLLAMTALSVSAGQYTSRSFKAIDKDKNGFIDQKEHHNVTKLIFNYIDENDDGYLSEDEIKKDKMGRMMLEDADNLNSLGDANNDRKISFSEYTEHRNMYFKMADLNQDALVTEVEMDKYYKYKYFTKKDLNKDFVISPEEFMKFDFSDKN